MARLLNRVRFATASVGTGSIVVGAAVPRYRTPAQAGVVTGDTLRYWIEDGLNWEFGTGVYNSTGPTLTRVLGGSSTGALLNLTGAAVVFSDAAVEDLVLVNADGTAENYNGSQWYWSLTPTFSFGADKTNHIIGGFESVNGYAWIQALTDGVAFRDMYLNPRGGQVLALAAPVYDGSVTNKQYVDGKDNFLLNKINSLPISLTRSQIPTKTITAGAVYVTGESIPGDHGQGALYVASSSAGLNGIQDAIGTWFNLSCTNLFHVGWFGATGNGITDDTAAIQAALNAAAATGNAGKVQFGYGTYKISSTLVVPTGIWLEGMGSIVPWGDMFGLGGGLSRAGTKLAWYGSATGTMLVIGATGTTTAIFGVTISNINFDGRMSAPYTGTMVTAIRHQIAISVRIKEVTIMRVGYGVVYLPIAYTSGMFVNSNHIDGLTVMGCWRGLYFNGNGDDTNGVAAADSFFQRIFIRELGPYGIGIDMVDWCDHNFFSDVQIRADDATSICLVINSADVANNGVSVIDFKNTMLVNNAGLALRVNNTHGTNFNFDGSIIGETDVDPITSALATIKDNSHGWTIPVPTTIYSGPPVNSTTSATPADLYTGAEFHFNIADWVRGSAYGGYTAAQKAQILYSRLRKVEVVVDWTPANSGAWFQIIDATNSNALMNNASASGTARQTTKVDLTPYIMSGAPNGVSAAAWATAVDRVAKFQFAGNGAAAAVHSIVVNAWVGW